MSKLSVTDAAFYGFGLVGRDPLTFLGAVLCYTGMGVVLAFFFLPAYANMLSVTLSAPDDQEAVLAATMQMFGAIGPVLLAGLLVGMIVLGAVQRSLVFGQSQGWFLGLKLGADELRVLIVTIVGYIIAAIVPYIGMLIVGGVLVGVFAAMDGGGAAAFLMFPVIIAGFCVMIWLSVRLSAAGPATVGESRFVIFESWKITKGRFWKLFLAFLLLYVVVFVAELLIFGLVGGVVGYMAASSGGPESFDPSMFEHIQFGPLMIIGAAVYGVIATFFLGGFLGVGAKGYLDWKQSEGGSADVFS